jgi:hypothetical protein
MFIGSKKLGSGQVKNHLFNVIDRSGQTFPSLLKMSKIENTELE